MPREWKSLKIERASHRGYYVTSPDDAGLLMLVGPDITVVEIAARADAQLREFDEAEAEMKGNHP